MSASGLQVTGSTTVIASLVEHDDNQVKLKRSVTGKISTVPLDKLSLEDLAYVRRLRETTPSDDSAAPSHDTATETDEAASSFEPLSTGMSEVGVSEGWKTSERLLLAADTNRKEDETVWVNRDGTCVAHIEKRGEKARMVINGRPEAWYDKVSVASLSPYTVFFGGGEHYAYRATQGDILKDKDKSCIVIDGKPGEFFEFIDTRKTHFSRAHFSWTYLVRLGDKGYCVSDGQKAVLGGGYEVLVSALALNGHSLVSPSSEFVCLNRVA